MTQLEFRPSKETGDMKYAKASAKLEAVHGMYPNSFLLPTSFNNLGRSSTDAVHHGRHGRLLLQYLQAWVQAGSHRDEMVHAREGGRGHGRQIKELVHRRGGVTSLVEMEGMNLYAKDFLHPRPSGPLQMDHLIKRMRMDHLSCFVPGMLALGPEGKAPAAC